MNELNQLITDALGTNLSDCSIIELMVLEGLPREACPEILQVFKSVARIQQC